jgi:hypothetical protein
MAADQAPVAAVSGPAELESLPPEADQALTRMLESYFAVTAALASDSTGGVADAALELATTADALVTVEIPSAPHFWHKHPQAGQLAALARAVAEAGDIAQTRERLAAVSAAMSELLHATGVPSSFASPVHELHCPMFLDGSVWLQDAGEVRNPYYGSAMLGCFDTRIDLPGAAQSAETSRGLERRDPPPRREEP